MADVLTGRANPSGRLAVTFPMDYFDSPSAVNYPYHKLYEDRFLAGQQPAVGDEPRLNWNYVDYEEDIYVGYRYYDAFGVSVSYPFGYGLTYTEFAYDAPSITATANGWEVSVRVTNTGSRAGKEVVQVYVSAPSGVEGGQPDKEIRAFAKTALLAAGESQTLRLSFTPEDLASFSEVRSAWVTGAGEYRALVARSATDIVCELPFVVYREVVRQCHDVLKPQHEVHRISDR